MKKWIAFLIIIILSVIIFRYINQDHRDINAEKAEYALTSLEISNEFLKNSSNSEIKYLNKTIEVTGHISEVNKNNLTISETVFCQFNEPLKSSIKTNNLIQIKGRVIGYDDLLEQIKLDQCTIIN